MLRGVLTVGGWTMASRILGFARDVLIAAVLGAGPLADAFFVALRLPNLFRRLFGEGAFNAAFVPAFVQVLTQDGPAAASRLARRMATLLAVWLGLLCLLGWLAMPWVIGLLAPGFSARPDTFAVAVELGRITLPYLPLICLTALAAGVLNSLGRFTAAAAAPLLFNLLAMAALFVLAPFTATPAHALAWGVALSGVAQLALVLWAAARAGQPLHVPLPPRLEPAERTVLRRMGPGLVGAGVQQLSLVVDTIVASLLPAGAVSFLYYADRLAQLPLGVIGAAIGTALLPALSRDLSAGRRLSAHRSMNRAIELSLFCTLPAAFGLAVAAEPLVAVLFGRGAFDAAAAAATAPALACYAIGLPAAVLQKVLLPGFFARGDTRTPVVTGGVAVGVAVACNLMALAVLPASIAHIGVALASSVAAWTNLGLLAWRLRRLGGLHLDRRLRRAGPRILLATLLMAAVALGLRIVLFPAAPGWRWVYLGAILFGAALSYLAAARLLRLPTIASLRFR